MQDQAPQVKSYCFTYDSELEPYWSRQTLGMSRPPRYVARAATAGAASGIVTASVAGAARTQVVKARKAIRRVLESMVVVC